MDKQDNDVVDPAAYEFMRYIRTFYVDLSALPVWKQQFLSDYVPAARAEDRELPVPPPPVKQDGPQPPGPKP